MFWRHDRKIFKSIVIGIIRSLGVCSISDIFIPFLSGFILGVSMKLHVCIIEHPMLIFLFVTAGIFTGLIVPTQTHHSTIFSHSMHVFISSMASILYLMSFDFTNWIPHLGMVFIFIFLAVIILCCISDIILPLLFTKRAATTFT